jgi:hypothetical protein
MAQQDARAKRTQSLIDDFRDNNHEFQMLKGILCMSNTWSSSERTRLYRLFDVVEIAKRMDEINNAARERTRAEPVAIQQSAGGPAT